LTTPGRAPGRDKRAPWLQTGDDRRLGPPGLGLDRSGAPP
jgi:hypothetical protein